MTRSSNTRDNDVLERNVETLLESGGEAPKLPDGARARIRAQLIAKHGKEASRRSPLIAIGLGLAATAAAALIVTRVVGGDDPTAVPDGPITKLADGSSWITEGSSKVTVLGHRRVRVEGAALLDVAPGKGTFVVETARGTIHVLGTRFLVDATADRTTTAVVRGQVKLATSTGDVILHAGEQAVAEPGRPPTRGPAPRLSHLVSWAAQARKRAETTDVVPMRNGTLFARDPGVRNGQFGEEKPLPLKKLGVDIVVENQVARVALDQTFHNEHDTVLEGVYRFAIPPDAALQRLAMYVDGTLTESAVVERMRARRIYEELVYRRVDPALLEWAGTGRLSLRVYPLPAHEDKRLMLAYTQSLPKLYTDWSLSVPLPEIDQPVGEIALDVTLRGCANCEITSTSHKIAVTRAGEDAKVTYRNTSEKIGDSIVLNIRDARQETSVATAKDGKDSFVMVRTPANLERKERTYRPRTWVILDDVSASRGAMERRAQSDLVDAFVRELDEEDKLAVIAFDVEARQKLAPTRVIDIDRRALRSLLKEEGDVGATDFAVALAAALKSLEGVPPEDAMIVYLGDGIVTSGTRHLDALRTSLAGKARFIGVGIGDGPDTQTLEALAAATGGFSATIDLADDLGWRAFDLVAALHTARVTGIEARLVDANGQLVPSALYLRSPQVADGEELELVAKLAGDGTPAAVELTGTMDGKPWQRRVALDAAPTTGGYLPRTWAQRHIAARMLAKHEPIVLSPCTATTGDQRPARTRDVPPVVKCPTEAEARTKRDEAIRLEVVELGKQYFLLSRHTSLIVLENDKMYAQYGVRKGSGDTWAPYALPAKIPVVKVAPNIKPADVASDAEMVRTPLQVFYNYNQHQQFGWNDFSGGDFDADDGWGFIGTGRFGTIGRGSGTGSGFGAGGGRTRASLRLADGSTANPLAPDPSSPQPDLVLGTTLEEAEEKSAKGPRIFAKQAEPSQEAQNNPLAGAEADDEAPMRRMVRSNELDGRRERGLFSRDTRHGGYWGYGGNILPQRYTYPTDTAFDDLTSLVPALFPDATDEWRERLLASKAAKPYAIDDAAKQLLEAARRALPAGVYQWDELEIAVDSARRMGWRRTTEADLAETASFDGTTLTRRYAELGLDVTRAIGDDDVALALGYLPVWIAEPAHYARYFEVRAKGPRQVSLATVENGKPSVAFVLDFDDKHRLIAIRDGEGNELLAISWGALGPASARARGQALSVGFTAQGIGDAPAWAHGATQAQRVVVELPGRMPAYWAERIAKETAGSPAWRQAQRQHMAALAATQNRHGLFQAFDALQKNGGAELGDLVLASGGIATAATDQQFAAALAPFTDPKAPIAVARYLIIGRAFGKNQVAARMKPEVTTGLVGALWQLREITALAVAGKGKDSVDKLVAMGNRALQLRLIAAAIATQRYELKAPDVARAWDTVAVGRLKNVARAQAAFAMGNRGASDAAAERIAALVADLDLNAIAPQLQHSMYQVQQSRRGTAGWQLIWATWRDRVLAGGSYEHVLSIAALANQHPNDMPAILARAVALAGDDLDRKIAIARMAMSYGMTPYAQTLVDELVAKQPTRELHQIAAQFAQQQQRHGDALAHLEAAQNASGDEAVSLATVQSELTQIITLARQVAIQSTGATRADAVKRAMAWGAKWRAIDPGNTQIDRLLGELQLAVGNHREAWRQLSSVIERDPMSGAGYQLVAEAFEREGRVAEALEYWHQAIVIEQTNPTPRMRKAQALIALGRAAEGDALLAEVANGKWHDMWSGVSYQAKYLLERAKQQP